MLIVHASSSCDICLDAYDWDTPTQMPHAIPCGHIFCKTCLTSMGSSCPFCRNQFVANRIVKLHVDRPATLEQGVEDIELLQRLGAEEAKRQVELEAALVQSKQRERALRGSLERARRLRKQREEEAEARKQREKEAEARKQREKEAEARKQREEEAEARKQRKEEAEARKQRKEEAEARKQRKKEAKAPKQREKEAEARKQQPPAVVGQSASASAAPSPTRTPSLRFFSDSYTVAPTAIRWERRAGGGWIALDTDADLTSSLANSTDAPHTSFTLGDFGDGNGFL